MPGEIWHREIRIRGTELLSLDFHRFSPMHRNRCLTSRILQIHIKIQTRCLTNQWRHQVKFSGKCLQISCRPNNNKNKCHRCFWKPHPSRSVSNRQFSAAKRLSEVWTPLTAQAPILSSKITCLLAWCSPPIPKNPSPPNKPPNTPRPAAANTTTAPVAKAKPAGIPPSPRPSPSTCLWTSSRRVIPHLDSSSSISSSRMLRVRSRISSFRRLCLRIMCLWGWDRMDAKTSNKC